MPKNMSLSDVTLHKVTGLNPDFAGLRDTVPEEASLARAFGHEALAELAEVISRMRPASELLDGMQQFTCPVSNKVFVASTLDMMVQDPILKGGVLDERHPDMKKVMTGAVGVACNNCRKVVLWLRPGKLAYGYVAKSDRLLHTLACPRCLELYLGKAGLTVKTPILELKAAECREKGLDFRQVVRQWSDELLQAKRQLVAGVLNQPETPAS